MYAFGIAAGTGFEKCCKADRLLFAEGDLSGGGEMEGIKE